MTGGTMFRILHDYPKKAFRDEHPIVKLYIGNEVREYEVFAVFYDKVYYQTDTCFKFYEFTEIDTEERFNEGISYFKSHSVYDTGITPEYGDRLLTLVTCSYHTENGRIVVVAREIAK
jgi:sortase B